MLILPVSLANQDLDVAMLRGALIEALKNACGKEPSQKTLNTSLIMIKDQETMDMIGIYYMIMEFFYLDKQVDLGPEFFFLNEQVSTGPMGPDIDRKLDIHELVDLIKSRNDAYCPVTTEFCAAMFRVLNSSHYRYRLPVSCQGRRWFAVGLAFSVRDFERDKEDEWENEAISIYKKMVKDSDELKASQNQPPETRVGKRLAHGFDHLLGSKVK